MLPESLRLRANREFQRVYGAGRSWAHPLLALHVLPRPEGQRVGLAVSRKVGSAVVRNRVRRRLRELVRAHASGWKSGVDIVLVARAAAAAAPYAALGTALAELARRSRLAREPEAAPGTLYTMPAGGRPPRREARSLSRSAASG